MLESGFPDELTEHLRATYADAIGAFVIASEGFERAIANRSTSTQVGFLTAIEPALVALYATFMRLPDTELWFDDDDDEADDEDGVAEKPDNSKWWTSEQVKAGIEERQQRENERIPLLAETRVSLAEEMTVAEDIQKLLGRYNAYWGGFDPYEEEGECAGTLSDDLGSIDALLRTYVPLCQSDDLTAVREGLYNLRWDFDHHTGQHLLGALRAVYFLLRFDRYQWTMTRGRMAVSSLTTTMVSIDKLSKRRSCRLMQ